MSDDPRDTPFPDHPEGDDLVVPEPRTFQPRKRKADDKVPTEELLAHLNRALPFSDDAEKGLLSGIVQDPVNRLTYCSSVLPAEAFYHTANRAVYELLLSLQERDTPIDVVTVTHGLREAGTLDKCGGPGAVSDLYSFMPIAVHWDFYLRIVKDKWLLRLYLNVCAQNIHEAYEHGKEHIDEPVEALLTGGWDRLFQIMQKARGLDNASTGPQPFRAAVNEAIDQLEANMDAIREGRQVSGARLGIASLDRALGGIQPGARLVFGAHSSVGKTSFLMSAARSLCIDQQMPGLIFSQDGLQVTLARRALASIAEVNITDIHSGHGFFQMEGRRKQDRLQQAVRVAGNMPLWVQDDATLTFPQMLAEARRMIIQHDIKWVAWDFFQCLSMGGSDYKGDRIKELNALSRAWKSFLMETKCIGIMLCQLNWEDKQHGRFTQKNIKDSKTLYDDAEIVVLKSREEKPLADLLKEGVAQGHIGEKDAREVPPLRLFEHVIRAEVSKNKDGPTGPVWVRHYASQMTWHTLTVTDKVRDSSFNAANREAAREKTAEFQAALPNYADPNYDGPRGRPRKGEPAPFEDD
jgi:replicative DNA helicase